MTMPAHIRRESYSARTRARDPLARPRRKPLPALGLETVLALSVLLSAGTVLLALAIW